MKKIKAAITIRSFGSTYLLQPEIRKKCDFSFINRTGKHLTEDELVHVLQGIDGVIAGTEIFSKNVIESLGNLKVISRVGVGLDSIDLDAAKRRGIKILNTPEAPVQAVAEHTLALIFDLMKKISRHNEKMHQGDYSTEAGNLLAGKRVGIIGLGRIGYRVATLLDALGCSIVFYDPFAVRRVPDTWCHCRHIEQLLQSSDIITLHLPSQPCGSPLLDKAAFSHMKKGVIIVNTARGTLIEESALIETISTGQVAAAGLDVFTEEPYKGRLLDFPEVIMTPHIASNTVESRQQMEIEAINNMIKAFEGEL